MRTPLAAMLAVLALAGDAAAQSPPLQPALAPIGFLIGHWTGGEGRVAETGGTSRGVSTITVEAGGGALLRRDHTELFDAAGKPAGGFDQIMMIYPEGGGLRADYSDGDHVIHYVTAEVSPGRLVTFSSAAQIDAPAFRLTYELENPDTLAVIFAAISHRGQVVHPIATGVLHRKPAAP